MKKYSTPYSPYVLPRNGVSRLRKPLVLTCQSVVEVGLFVLVMLMVQGFVTVQAAGPPVADACNGPFNSPPQKETSKEPKAVDATEQKNRSKRDELKVLKDQRFSQQKGRAGLCDVYLPNADPPASGYPVVVVLHGGGWISGDKWTVATYSRLLAREGIVTVTINYRLAPVHKFPSQVDDLRSALVWVTRNAERFKLNRDRVGLFGYSAGGHLSLLLASLADETMEVRSAASNWPVTDARWKELPDIVAVCAGGPPCDFRSLPIDNTAMTFFLGGSRRDRPEAYVAASPAEHVSKDDPVTLLFHGEADALVPLAGTSQFHNTQLEAGIDSQLVVIAKQGHMLTFISPQTYQTVVNFFRKRLLQPSDLP